MSFLNQFLRQSRQIKSICHQKENSTSPTPLLERSLISQNKFYATSEISSDIRNADEETIIILSKFVYKNIILSINFFLILSGSLHFLLFFHQIEKLYLRKKFLDRIHQILRVQIVSHYVKKSVSMSWQQNQTVNIK